MVKQYSRRGRTSKPMSLIDASTGGGMVIGMSLIIWRNLQQKFEDIWGPRSVDESRTPL